MKKNSNKANNLTKKYKIRKVIAIILIIIFTIELGIFIYLNLQPNFIVKRFDNNLEINYKEKYSYKDFNICYGNYFKCNKVKYEIKGKVNIDKLGSNILKYVFTYKGKKKVINQVVNVVDKEKPILETDVNEVVVCPNGVINAFDIKASDNYDGDLTSKIIKEYKDDIVVVKVKDSSDNETIKEFKAVVEDKQGPEITINGREELFFNVGSSYDDEGGTAKDNCDGEVKVESSSDINFSNAGTYSIKYSATDSSGNTSTKERKINVRNIETGNRIVYLTFDDGPSVHTARLLDILKKYNVKATFFVTGNGSDDMILREYQEGHTVALHTNTHNYCYLYASVDNYFEDLYAIRDRVKRITGQESRIIRFPGGSSNMVSADCDGGIHIMSILVNEVQNRGFYYFDWNISSGDAGGTTSSDGVYNNVVSHLSEGKNIVLQHDIKGFSVDAVERIIQFGLSNGYEFKALDETSYGSHHRVFN